MKAAHLLAVVAAAFVLALAGCGGDDDDDGGGGNGGDEAAETQPETGTTTTPAPGEEGETAGGDAAAAEQVIRDYLDGVADGDAAKVCDQFTDEALRELEVLGGCEEFFGEFLQIVSEEQKEELRSADPEVEVDGDRATATIPSLEGDGEEEITLQKVDGEWKFAENEAPGEGP
jgi:ketosteroid isomerase-like protein